MQAVGEVEAHAEMVLEALSDMVKLPQPEGVLVREYVLVAVGEAEREGDVE